MQRAADVTQLIGKTPLIRLNKIPPPGATVWLKLEGFNPGGSIKDRIALSMIEEAEAQGKIKPGATLVEPTSGNTGIGLAMVAAAKGYKLILVMPASMSSERRKILQAYGAQIVLTPGKEGMEGSIAKAQDLCRLNPDYFMPQQFTNPANPRAHEEGTAQEIWQQMEGELAALVSAVGTGGTVSGVARSLKKRNPKIIIAAVEPASSAVLSGEKPGIHKIQGIGAGFIPQILDRDLIDRIFKVSDEEAYTMAVRLAREEGLLLGISSGAAVSAAIALAVELDIGQNIVAIAPDTGERYLSTDLFDHWK
ncbi:MAG: cysteine synthase A [Firmicutes bacterium]|nr:cysteine synthase A [Bacillota bacterium]